MLCLVGASSEFGNYDREKVIDVFDYDSDGYINDIDYSMFLTVYGRFGLNNEDAE